MLDRQERINMAVAQQLERLPAGMSVNARKLCLQLAAFDCYESVDGYLRKLCEYGHLEQHGFNWRTKAR